MSNIACNNVDEINCRKETLKRHLIQNDLDHKQHILKELSLKNAHVYCVVNNLSAQKFGPLIELYMIETYGFKKNSSTQCIGDCVKHDENYEIKVSLGGAHHNRFNYVQIRLSHGIAYYILTAYHLTFENLENEGELYIFKVPKKNMKELILTFGSYAHGTIKEHNQITIESLDDPTNTKEYALRTTIDDLCWKQLLTFRIQDRDL